MNEKISEFLEKDEQLLFITKPEQFEFLDKTNKSSFVLKVILSFSITAIVLALYLIKAAKMYDIKWGLVAVIAVLGGYIGISDIFSSKKLKKVKYALTNKRIIILADPEKSVALSEIKEYVFKSDDDGHISLLIGKNGINLPAKKWRNVTSGPVDRNEETSEVLKYAIYAIEDAKRFEKMFKEAITVK